MAMKIANQYINMKLLRTMSFLRLAEKKGARIVQTHLFSMMESECNHETSGLRKQFE